MKKEISTTLLLVVFTTLFVLLVMAILLVGCNHKTTGNRYEQNDTSNQLVLDSTSKYVNRQFSVYTLNGCEYIVVGYGHSQWGSHKGDCKNPIHQYNSVDTVEKHFDCTIQEIGSGDSQNKYMYTTECGITFYSNSKYRVGERLENFKSPKHK